MYEIGLSQLSAEEAFSYLKRLVHSEHFGDYQVRGDSTVETTISRTSFGRRLTDQELASNEEDAILLRDIAGGIDALLDSYTHSEAKLNSDRKCSISLALHLPDRIKKELGFDDAQRRRIPTVVHVSVEYQSASKLYDLQVSHPVLPSNTPVLDRLKDKKVYIKWATVLEEEVRRLLGFPAEEETGEE